MADSTLHQKLLADISPPAGTPLTDLDPNAWLAALRAVVELHAPFQCSTLSLGCRSCSTLLHTQPGRYVTVVPWPCSTIQVIADTLGIAP